MVALISFYMLPRASLLASAAMTFLAACVNAGFGRDVVSRSRQLTQSYIVGSVVGFERQSISFSHMIPVCLKVTLMVCNGLIVYVPTQYT